MARWEPYEASFDKGSTQEAWPPEEEVVGTRRRIPPTRFNTIAIPGPSSFDGGTLYRTEGHASFSSLNLLNL